MPEPDPILWQILLQILLIAVNAVFACAEIAVITINDMKLERMAAAGNKRAKRLMSIIRTPSKFFATIQVAITLAGFLGSAFAADNFASRLADWAESVKIPLPYSTLNAISLILITLILSYFTLVLGELVPKRVAQQKAEPVALALSGVIVFLSKVFAPVVWLLTKSNDALLRLLNIDPNESSNAVTEEEIRMMVDEGSEKGAIAETEKEIINNVFAFNDLTAEEVMTHRTNAELLWADETAEQWATAIFETRHSYYPIVVDDADDVKGVLSAKDYYRLAENERVPESIMENVMRPAQFVPEGVKADVLFRNMKNNRNHFAIVLDEYGGMSGIITINDLLEQLVGDLDDDSSTVPDGPDIMQLGESEWEIQGSASIDDVVLALGTELPAEDYDTFGGWVFSLLGSVPGDGETPVLETAGLTVEVTAVSEHRLERAVVRKKTDRKDGEDRE
ncbi:MAG: hemolysin family protein [Oscillospiraceae bacterium]|jgi:putative hemolysin|nr:hemolysin family protein [Oscillospiraceae bacterium]